MKPPLSSIGLLAPVVALPKGNKEKKKKKLKL
jgi:hypothetical protein